MPQKPEKIKPYVNAYVRDDKNQQVRFVPYDYQPLEVGVDFPNGISNALWVGAAGNVEVITAASREEGGSVSIVIPGVPGGSYILGQFIQVIEAGTTVADIEDNIRVVY